MYCACGLAAIDAYLSNVNASGPSSTELLVSPTEVFRPGEGIVSVDPALLTEMRLARAEFGQFGGTARPRMVSYQPLVSNVDEPNLALDGLGWGVASSQSVTTALAPNALRPKFALLAAVILAALLAPASYFIASQTAAPITRLTAVAMAVAAGNLQAKVPVETNDEIGVLATTFNDMTERLQLTLQTLERRVIERTQALEASLYDNERALLRLQANELEREGLLRQARKRAVELETVARVSADASRLLDVEQLLDAVVNLTKGSFGLYHAQIYLLTPAKDVLKMAAGAGEVGRALVTQGYAIAVNHPQALVAEAVRTQHLVVVNDVAAVLHFLPHPLLPDTHSEMAIPLIVGNTVLGVFDVQADTTGFFTSEEQRIQTVLATQIAVAVQNALLYAEQASTLAQLREVDQMKSSFLANMSHELRTPLNSILGFAEVMLEGIDGPLNELLHHDIQIIHRNGRHLLALISDILDMAKIESGTLRLQPEQLDLADLVLEALSTATPLARQKGLTLTFAPPAAPVLVKVDHARLRQVLLNLVSNAIKFTETGGITLDIKMHTSVVQLRVRDTGLGIPSSQHESIFEPFHQVDTSLTRKAGGTGLGLAISRYLVGMHSGRLWVESTGVAHEGACFILELPVLHDTEASHGII